MAQTIVYRAFTNAYMIYRGGYSHSVINSYEGDDIYNRDKVNEGCFLHLHSNEEINEFRRIFGFKKSIYESEKVDVNLSICFTSDGRMVMYNNEVSKAKYRVCQSFKTESSTVKKWGMQYHYYRKEEFPVTLKYWKIKGEYAIVSVFINQLLNLIPEVLSEYIAYMDIPFLESTEKQAILYMHDPIDLNQSWDYNEEEKELINKSLKYDIQ